MYKCDAKDIKGFTVTKFDATGKWMCDIVFTDNARLPDGRHISNSAPGWQGTFGYKELKAYVKMQFGLQLPNAEDLVLVGRNGAGKVYTSRSNRYLGDDLLNNTYMFLGRK